MPQDPPPEPPPERPPEPPPGEWEVFRQGRRRWVAGVEAVVVVVLIVLSGLYLLFR